MTTSIKRNFVSFPIQDLKQPKQQVLNWANQFGTCCFFDNNDYQSTHHSYECIAAIGVKRSITANAGQALDALKAFYNQEPDWLFGHIGYDLKNEIENLKSSHIDNIDFPDLYFFAPEYLIRLNEDTIFINSETAISPAAVFEAIKKTSPHARKLQLANTVSVKSRFTRQAYIETIEKIKQHILKGDCYEINFCQEFYVETAGIEPLDIFNALSEISPNPFAAYYKMKDKHLACASPERYIKKDKHRIICQPIKGTSQRNVNDAKEDSVNRSALFANAKERAENVMVVDLVRNDLSKICEEGSVRVDELFGIYSFPQVHQMISTISGTVSSEVHWTDIIKATFPMGSMTGAPKKKVMELIERYERTKRGVYSGATGYITPDGDFDFNVVIRSVLINTTTNYLSYQVGSAITFSSDSSLEYEECLLKAEAIRKVLNLS